MRIFKLFDSSGDGYISTREMQKISKAFGEEASLDEAEEMVEMADADCDGKVSFDEFKALMKEGRYVLLSAVQVKLNIKLLWQTIQVRTRTPNLPSKELPGVLLIPLSIHPYAIFVYSKASRYADFGSRKKPCSSKPCFVRFIPMY